MSFSIGSLSLANNLLLAPMAGVTDTPVRMLARRYGAALCFTEMVSANGVVRDGRKSLELVRTLAEDRPLGVQVFGDDAQTVAEAAERLQEYADLVDINMGCPVRKVVSGGAGSALLRDPDKVRGIIREVRRRVSLPLTVKIRTGWDAGEENYLLVGKIAQEEGCDALTFHPRTRSQMFSGSADWSKIRRLKETLSIPVIGNGDVNSAEDAREMLRTTGCDGVMLARGAMGRPWLFREILALLAGETVSPPSPENRLEDALYHLDLLSSLSGEEVAVREMRKHFSWYSKGLPGAARFRAAVNAAGRRSDMESALRELVAAA